MNQENNLNNSLEEVLNISDNFDQNSNNDVADLNITENSIKVRYKDRKVENKLKKYEATLKKQENILRVKDSQVIIFLDLTFN